MKNETGFSLLELMSTIAIAGILVAIAMPSYQGMVRNNCLTTTNNLLVTSLQLARSEAIKRRVSTGVYAPTSWATGWQVFVDTNEDGDLDGGETIIRRVDVTCGSGQLTVTEASNIDTFIYGTDGFIDQAGSFAVCAHSGERGKTLSISITGRANTDSSLICT